MPHKNPEERRRYRARKRAEQFVPTPDYIEDTKRRLLEKVEYAPNGCWLFTGSRNRAGYGQIGFGRRCHLAHRVSYQVFVGPITDRTLDHLCNTPACVNPEHLRPASDRENIMRGSGASAKNARKTHCVHGHEFTPENTYLFRGKWRMCRACARRKSRERYARSRG